MVVISKAICYNILNNHIELREVLEMEDGKKYIQRAINIASPVASALSLVNPAFLAIPVIASVSNELFAYFDSKSTEKRLLQLQNAIENAGVEIPKFAEQVSQLDEHSQYVVRNTVKHLCLSAQPEVTETLNKAIIDLIMNEPYGMPEHICEILQQCNADDIAFLRIIKRFQLNGDKSTYHQKLLEAQKDTKSGRMHDRSYFHGEQNTIFWGDFIKIFRLGEDVPDMSIFLNRKFTTKDSNGNFNEEIIDFAYFAKSIIKLQNLGVLQCDFIPTIGTSSLNHIDRFHITFFGQKLLEYIDIEEKNQ